MKSLSLWIGRLAGLAGVVVCAVSIGSRLSETYYVYGFPVGTLFQMGVGAMVFGCLAYLTVLAEGRGR